ncbi:MAG: ferrous iron transporter B, partial [Clostridiales bacterium]|nr:ferrous iron transporter B [Clostridiales bacterium]
GFLPQILMLFMWFSILEDSGYMARVAFVLDRIFRRFGLSGRSFMPMIMGFGCSVPAMINTRTLADENERTATIRVIPFFSCGAKLPILSAIAGGICTFFGVGNADLITYGMYALGVCAAVTCVLLMRNTTMKGDIPPFIMELPAYHRPQFKNLMLHLWDKTKHFVKKAFTIIFASTVIIWLFSHLNWSWHYLTDEQMNDSILASIGKFIQPLFTPLGFGSQLNAYGWVFAVAALTGLIAKENVIATFGTLGACLIAMGANVGGVTGAELLGDEEGIISSVAMITATGISIPALISFIAFNMLTIPCFAACATAKGELKKGTFKWTLLFWVASSYITSAAVFTIGAWWWTTFIWLAAVAMVVTLIVLNDKGKIKWRRRKTDQAEAIQ